MKNDLKIEEQRYRDFLLGLLSDEQREKLEGEFISSPDVFDSINVVEDELVEAYLRGTLTAHEKTLFESNFLSTDARRQKVKAAEALIESARRSKVSLPIAEKEGRNWFELLRWPQLAFSAAVVLLVATVSVVVYLNAIPTSQPEIAAVTETPLPQVVATIAPGKTQTEISNPQNTPKAADDQSKNIEKPPSGIDGKQPSLVNTAPSPLPKAQVETQPTPIRRTPPSPPAVPDSEPVLLLSAAGVRSGGTTSELRLPPNVAGATLKASFEQEGFTGYRLEILDQDGRIIHEAKNLRSSGKKVSIWVPARKLKRGDYIVRLYGTTLSNTEESVQDYQFRVVPSSNKK